MEAILGHQGSPANRSRMTFQVKWKGYDELSWEPWANVRDNVILHNYLKTHKLHKLIPKRFNMGSGF